MGSPGLIKTYGTGNIVKGMKIGGNIFGAYGLYRTYDDYSSGRRDGFGASLDAVFGGVGFLGWPGAAISTSYELGKVYGPSTWYGNNDYKWFE